MDVWRNEFRKFIAEREKEYDQKIAELTSMEEDIKRLAEKKRLYEDRNTSLIKLFDEERGIKRKANTEELPAKKRKIDQNVSEKVDKTDKKPRQKRSTNTKKCQQDMCKDSSTEKMPAQTEMKPLDTTLTVEPSSDIYDSSMNKENDRFVYLRTTRDMKKKLLRDLYKYCGNQGQANIVDNLTKDILDVVESTLEKNTNMFSLGLVLSFTGERREEGDRRPYYIPYSRTYTRSEFETILHNEFERSVMSNNINDFLNDDIYLRVDYVLKDSPADVGGRFRGIVNRFGYDNSQLLSIKSTTNDCLFEALYIARKFTKPHTEENTNKRRVSWKKVRRFVHDVNDGNVKKIQKLREKVAELKEATGTDTPGPYSAQEIGSKFQEYLERKCPKEYQIQFFDENHTLKPFIRFGNPGAAKVITIFLHNEHFAVIMDMKKFLQLDKRSQYCLACNTTFHKLEFHNVGCPFRCGACQQAPRNGKCKIVFEEAEDCPTCNVFIPNAECKLRHIGTTERPGSCQKINRCTNCNVHFKGVRKNGRIVFDKHICGYFRCDICHDFHEKGKCFIQPKKIPEKEFVIYVFTDLESVIDECGLHTPNYNAVYLYCSTCQDNGDWKDEVNHTCKFCPTNRIKTFSSLDGEDPVADFFHWMTTLPNERIVVVAHNGGRYDYQLFYNHMVNTNWEALDVTRNGPKFYKIDFKVTGRKKPIRFIDSVNFIPMSLSNLPKTFNLDVNDKGYFPYMANSMTDYTLDELPPIESFGYASKPPQAQLDLKKWYDENKQTKWNLKKELDHYCKNDVRILAHACQKFIVEWQKKNNFNPFVLSTTIASACMTTFRMNYLEPETVAITPTHGYGAKKNASEMGAKLMLYIAEIFGFGGKDSPFWHVSTRRGEKKIGKYYVDGFCHDDISGIDYIIEFDGAFWHGDPSFPAEKSSLYPSIMSSEEFPIGHPEYMAIFEDVNWTKPEDVVLDGVEIRGVLKVVLEPPEKCLHPPVPYKTKTHLLFGLCKACCDNAQKIKNVKDCYKCEHTIEQRRFTATITSIELKMALAANFKCTHVFAAVHYDKWSNAIFHDYVKSFLKSKQEASGWPSHCTADAEKKAFLQKIKDVDGIELDPNN
uniref:DNA-directed DNA polymerase n=1 Tax=Panagrolaimus sp. JU765 TaxID=591449 RepID=A0AC34RHK7_9BILA